MRGGKEYNNGHIVRKPRMITCGCAAQNLMAQQNFHRAIGPAVEGVHADDKLTTSCRFGSHPGRVVYSARFATTQQFFKIPPKCNHSGRPIKTYV